MHNNIWVYVLGLRFDSAINVCSNFHEEENLYDKQVVMKLILSSGGI